MGGVERIELARFTPARTRELLVAILGEDPRRDLIAHVVERSDGNPFFIEELVMAERTLTTDRGMPPTLRGILLARIEHPPRRGAVRSSGWPPSPVGASITICSHRS